MPLNVVFMGTPDFAVPTLLEIAGQGHQVAAVYTRAPKRAGRGMAERRSPVQQAAERLGLPVLHPSTLRSDEAAHTMRGHAADVAVVVAYGLILPAAILAAPAHGCLNLHASLLPRWRGAAPIQRAIMAGDSETGVAIMQMEEGLDTGPVAMMERVAIPANATAADLHDVLARLGADLMGRALGALERGQLRVRAQPADGVTYAHKISKDEAQIDWSRPAQEVHNRIRGLSPFPGAWCMAPLGGTGERLKLLRSAVCDGNGAPGTLLCDDLTIACGDGAVRLIEVQRAGRGPTDAAAFMNGARLVPGALFR